MNDAAEQEQSLYVEKHPLHTSRKEEFRGCIRSA